LVEFEDAETGGRVIVDTASASFRRHFAAAAARLRERGSKAGIAYYHAGLPVRVRRVIEQLFLDGKITTLVDEGAFPELFAPGDISQVLLLGLPFSRTQLWEAAALGGLAGRGATIVLAYQREDVERNRAALDERHPSRPRLAALYRVLKEEGPGTLLWPGETLSRALQAAGVSPGAIEPALDTLAEAGVIQRELVEGRWRIDLLPEVSGHDVKEGSRRDLTASLRFAEGARERAAQEALIPWAFGPASAILRVLAGPVAPDSRP
jgi:hypothetical protein